MNTNLTIKNFRVFDENGVTLELKPITILTGRNSSGKSSVVKAAMFLNAFLCQIKKAIDEGEMIRLENYKVDFTKYPFNLLGNFDMIVHKGGTLKEVTMSYSIFSFRLSKEVNVEFVFSADENDVLKKAVYLKSLTLSTEDGVFYSSSRQSGSELNLSMLKDACYVFLLIEHHKYLKKLKEQGEFFPDMPDSISDTEYEAKTLQIVELLKLYKADSQRIQEVEKRSPDKIDNSIISRRNAQQTFHTLMEWSFKNDSLFNIPILDELDKISKDELKTFIETIIQIKPKVDNTAIKKASEKIIDDFIKSESDNFSSYFKSYENKYLCNVTSNNVFMECRVNIDQRYIGSYYDTPKSRFYSKTEKEDYMKRWRNEWEERPIDFDMLYEVVMEWNAYRTNFNLKSDFYYYLDYYGTIYGCFVHKMYELLNIFASDLFLEVICPEWIGPIEYVSSNILKVKRFYSLDNDEECTRMLINYYKHVFIPRKKPNDALTSSDDDELYNLLFPERKYTPFSFMNKWVKKFELGEAISVSVDNDGSVVKINLHKKVGDKGVLLADEGYGISQLFFILLKIELAILSYGRDNKQITIAIEEPEIHLHPQYQSLLADMFLEAYKDYHIQFIVETHSEYLVRKSQVLVANENYDSKEILEENNPFMVFYIDGKNEQRPCYKMEYRTDGNFSNEFGTGFFDEANKLLYDIL